MIPPKGFESVINEQVKLVGTVLDNRSGTGGKSSLGEKGTVFHTTDGGLHGQVCPLELKMTFTQPALRPEGIFMLLVNGHNLRPS